VALLILIMMQYWGGTASPGPFFVLGVAALSGLLLIFGLALWWLFASPLPAGPAAVRPAASAELRQLVAILVVISGLLFITGGVWDEIWHRQYGIGEVLNDFFWRPHQMIYGSMGLTALFALAGLFLGLRGQGDLRRRFRAEPFMGFLGVAAAYLSLSGPSDLVWHQAYGLDITAWSLPHMMFAVGFGLVFISAVALQLSVLPRARAWRGLRGLQFEEGLIIVMLAIMMIVVMQIGVTEWESFRPVTGFGFEGDLFVQAFLSRPEWLYPVALILITVFNGSLAIRALRRAGAATLTALLVLGYRVIVLTAFDLWGSPIRMTVVSQLAILSTALALDLWYALRLKQAETTVTLLGGALAALVGFLAGGLPVIPLFIQYPRISAETLPGILVMGLAVALWSAWVGARLAGWLNHLAVQRETEAAAATAGLRVRWVGAGVLVALVLFTAYFVATAQPPV
jgi:hypothetical protein